MYEAAPTQAPSMWDTGDSDPQLTSVPTAVLEPAGNLTSPQT